MTVLTNTRLGIPDTAFDCMTVEKPDAGVLVPAAVTEPGRHIRASSHEPHNFQKKILLF